MGSFNGFCFVSNQVITPTAKCVIMPIIQSSTYDPVNLTVGEKELAVYGIANSTCYSTCYWSYFGGCIEGAYDDYGQFNIADSELNRQMLESFFAKLLSEGACSKPGKSEYRDPAFNMKELYTLNKAYSFEELLSIWEKVWEVSQQHRLFALDTFDNTRPVQFAVMLQRAADLLIETIDRKCNYADQPYERKQCFFNYLDGIKERFDSFRQKHKLSEELFFMIDKIAGLNGYPFSGTEGLYLFEFYNSNKKYDQIECCLNKCINEQGLLHEGPFSVQIKEELFEIAKHYINHLYINAGLNSFNLKLSPFVTAGQDYDNKTGKAYAEFVKIVSDLACQDIDEYMD